MTLQEFKNFALIALKDVKIDNLELDTLIKFVFNDIQNRLPINYAVSVINTGELEEIFDIRKHGINILPSEITDAKMKEISQLATKNAQTLNVIDAINFIDINYNSLDLVKFQDTYYINTYEAEQVIAILNIRKDINEIEDFKLEKIATALIAGIRLYHYNILGNMENEQIAQVLRSIYDREVQNAGKYFAAKILNGYKKTKQFEVLNERY